MTLQPTYASARLRLWRRLRQEANGGSVVELFRPSSAELRFRLGTSLADLRIPFKISPALLQAFTKATIDAYLLLGHRHKASISPTEYDKLVTTEGFDPNTLRPLTYALPSAVRSDHVRRAFTEAMQAHVGLDAGVVASFFGTGGPGRALSAALHGVFVKAREEGLRNHLGEPTPLLVALILRSLAESTYGITRDAPIGEPMARFIRTAVGVLLAEATHLALREAGFTRSTDAAADPREVRWSLTSVASLGTLPFLGPRPALAGTGLSLYGVVFDQLPPGFDDVVARLPAVVEPEELIRELTNTYQRDRELQRRMERLGAFAALRESCRELASLVETSRSASFSLTQDGRIDRVLNAREGLERLFASETRRKDLARTAKEATRLVASDALREKLEYLAHAAREYRDEDPAGWLGPTEARLRAARATVALATDILIDRCAAQAGQLLLERTGAETEGGEAAEYESGRLYYVSNDERPLLMDRGLVPQVGHLFCDMKDFTRRTAFLKESVIADFLQREFYSPILAAASGADPGARALGTAPKLALNNLLGDAASFSGDIVALMTLAKSIHSAFKAYGGRLSSEASTEAVAERVRELEKHHAQRRAGFERRLRDVTTRAKGAANGQREALLQEAEEIRAELTRFTALLQADIARAAGEKLEAGIFVSYGAAPEVVRFEDPFFGPLKVAIAEKINESARGTARNGAVREKIEILRHRASLRAGRELELPFAVLVEPPATVTVAPEEAMLIAELVSRGETALAQERLLRAVQQTMARPAPTGELYNNGIACSEEALRAYLEARSREVRVVRQDIPIASLPQPIREQFFFPHDPLQIVACIVPASRALVDLFVLQGRVLFRGFEATGGLGVYELIPMSAPLFELFARYHMKTWLSG